MDDSGRPMYVLVLKSMLSRLAASAILFIAINSCESSTALRAMTPSPIAVSCGEPAPVVAAPTGTGLADGIVLAELFLTASWRGNSDFHAGYPTKVAIHATSGVSLHGRRCSDGEGLRFWYRDGSPPLGELPASISKLEATGDLVARLEADSSASESHTGYIMFPSAGDYELMAGTPGSVQQVAVVRVG